MLEPSVPAADFSKVRTYDMNRRNFLLGTVAFPLAPTTALATSTQTAYDAFLALCHSYVGRAITREERFALHRARRKVCSEHDFMCEIASFSCGEFELFYGLDVFFCAPGEPLPYTHAYTFYVDCSAGVWKCTSAALKHSLLS